MFFSDKMAQVNFFSLLETPAFSLFTVFTELSLLYVLIGIIVKDPVRAQLFFIETQIFAVYSLKFPSSCLGTTGFKS